LEATKAKMIALKTTVKNDLEEFEQQVQALDRREDRLAIRMDELKAKQQIILEKSSITKPGD
jgi:chaperonin cofactor prefoldin